MKWMDHHHLACAWVGAGAQFNIQQSQKNQPNVAPRVQGELISISSGDLLHSFQEVS
jgi:hypothetical protein